MSIIYIDHQASTPIRQDVLEAMQSCWKAEIGNPHSSEHNAGIQASKLIEQSQQVISNVLACETSEIIFNSGASEGNNQTVFGVLNSEQLLSHKRRVIISTVEHKCVISAAQFWCARLGLDLQFVRVDQEGYVDQEHLLDLLKKPTALVSIMSVNNEIGTVQNLKALSEIVWSHDALFHSDCAQLMMASEQFCAPDVTDLCTFSGHKIGGPQGIGVLFASSNLQEQIEPMIRGGGQQNGLRAGTLPTPLVVGLAAAFKSFSCPQTNRTRMELLRAKSSFLIDEITRQFPDCELNGAPLINRHPGNLNLYFPNCESDQLLRHVFSQVAASTGSACNSGAIEPSYVLQALGHPPERAKQSIRLSLSASTTNEEIILAARIISQAALNVIKRWS